MTLLPLQRYPDKTNIERQGRIAAFNATPEKPFVLGLPTGSSPILIYQCLVQRHKAGDISFRNVITFNMVRSMIPCLAMYHGRTALSRLADEACCRTSM